MRSRSTGSIRGFGSTASPTSSSASDCATAAAGPSRWPGCPSRSMSTDCGSPPSRGSGIGCRNAICTASSTGGGIGKTFWSANRITGVGDDYNKLVGELLGRRKRNLAMGGEEKVARQHQRGKLTVRERIDLLFDPGTFVELGLLAQNRDGSDTAPADGVVTGHGDVDGRQVWVIAYDFTVMAGSMGAVGDQFKAARVRELAVRYRKRLVWLPDSGCARLQAW